MEEIQEEVTRISDLVLSGLKDSAAQLTEELRATAQNSGWNTAAVNSLKITASEKSLHLSASSEAESLEYGGLNEQAKPAVRQWLSNESAISNTFMSVIEDKIREVLK